MLVPETYLSISLIVLVAVIGIAYLRQLRKGRIPRFERVERQGGSLLLGKRAMEMGHWAAQPVSSLLLRLGIGANALSWSAVAFGACAGAAAAAGHFGVAAIVMTIAGILDMLDGMVARASGKVSASGKVLDSTLDRYVEFLFLAGVALHFRGSPAILLLTLAAILGSFMVSYSTALSEIQRLALPPGGMRRPERVVYLTLGAALDPIIGGYAMVAAIALVAILANGSAALRLAWLARELERRDQPQPSSVPAPSRSRLLRFRGGEKGKTVIPEGAESTTAPDSRSGG